MESSSVKKASQDQLCPKIEVHLLAVGDAPIMKQKKYQVDGNKTVGWIAAFIRKYLNLNKNDALYLYVSQAFSPSLDQTVKNIYQCFGYDKRLVFHYSKGQAWGWTINLKWWP